MARQARALDKLLAEVNAHAPNRSKASDGGLGDQAHAARVSDHNPNAAGVWTARDFTHDPTHGLDCNDLAKRLVGKFGSHPAMKSGSYIIWNGRIYSYARRTEGWRTYTGSNQHTKHLHLSVSDAAVGYDSTQRWNLWTAEPTPPPSDETKNAAMFDEIRDAWVNHRTVDRTKLSELQQTGSPRFAKVADATGDGIDLLMQAFLKS